MKWSTPDKRLHQIRQHVTDFLLKDQLAAYILYALIFYCK